MQGKKIDTSYLMPWCGGKKQLRETIYSLLPADLSLFAEVFCGASYVTLGREKLARQEIINDLNGDLMNLYKIIVNRQQELEEKFEFLFHSRAQFEYYKHLETDDELEKAVKFIFTRLLAFGGRVKEDYSAWYGYPKRIVNFEHFLSRARVTAKRSKKVLIENLDAIEFIEKYDREDMFFYLDPPYIHSRIFYNSEEKALHSTLAERLKEIKGRFLLSYNDCELVRDFYKDFDFIEVERHNSLSKKKKNNNYRELLIKNYKTEGLFGGMSNVI